MASSLNYSSIYEHFREKHARASDQILAAYSLSRWQPIYWLRDREFHKFYNFKKCVKKLEVWQSMLRGENVSPKNIKKQCEWWLSKDYLTNVKRFGLADLKKGYKSTELHGFGG